MSTFQATFKSTGATFTAAFLVGSEAIKTDFGEVIEVDRSVEYYDGPYEVTPAAEDQKLLTKNLHMRDDVTVEEIPYTETSNEYGITVYIG